MKYCAFLRGVNVKGTNMKMADVCKVFSEAGVQNVSSVLASGNILFQSDKDSVELKKILEKAMSGHFNYEAFLFIKDEDEINDILKNAPFPPIENFHSYIFLGSEKVEETLVNLPLFLLPKTKDRRTGEMRYINSLNELPSKNLTELNCNQISVDNDFPWH